MPAPRIAVANDELVTVREAMRSLNRLVAALEAGEAEKFVVMKRGRMVAVLRPLSHDAASRRDAA